MGISSEEHIQDFHYYVARSKASLNSSNDIGDFTLPHTGIIALEIELKIPIRIVFKS
jgi:hypothetical protein